jgi:arabinofuranosyltransferase
MTPRVRLSLRIAVGATGALLLAHAWAYRFLCDDAFISFRYARNLAFGHGLVFNPGGPAVEGYTNFLWVLILAAAQRAGVAPEHAALPLLLTATLGLWGIVVSWQARHDGASALARVAPPLLLAATRTTAVWSTSGLETRLFELLAVAGVLRLLVELEDDGRDRPSLRPWSGWILAAATLTRPDGALVGAMALAAGFAVSPLRARRLRSWGFRAAGFVLPLVAHEAFRVATYGAWLPNTFAAKVGGRTWWDMGLVYAGAFALEYGVFLWVPLVALACRRHLRRGTGRVPMVFAAATLPHLLYVVAIGGDHFEYRPLGLLVIFAALLIGDGLAEATELRGAPAAAAALAAVLFGITWLPARSHLQYPAERYRNTFPGGWGEDDAAKRWLDPASDPVLGWPLMRAWPRSHRAALDFISRAAVGLRQEEHALFLATVRPEGVALSIAIRAGRIPPNLHVALACVGAIPYLSDLRTLDLLGLTDARVARMPAVGSRRVLAHEQRDTAAYERAAGVDLRCLRAAHLFYPVDDADLLKSVVRAVGRGAHPAAARIDPGHWLVGTLPQGAAATRERFPDLRFSDLADPGALDAFVAVSAEALAARHRAAPRDGDVTIALGQARLLQGRGDDARALFEDATAAAPERLTAWVGLAGARAATGDRAGATAAVAQALGLVRRRGSAEDRAEIEALAARLSGAGGQPPPSAR